VLLLASVMPLLTGCQSTTASGGTESGTQADFIEAFRSYYCRIEQGVSYSSRDTEETQRSAREHNAVYLSQGCAGAPSSSTSKETD
jgi:hypothetical protein